MKPLNRFSALLYKSSRVAWYAGVAATALILFGGIGLVGVFFLSKGHW
jgi:hypothetical protein